MSIGIARRIGAALGVKSESKIRSLNRALTEYVRLTAQSAATQIAGSVPWGNITGKPSTFASNAKDDVDGSTLGNFANDAAAATGGVAVGSLYRNGSVVQVRVS